MNRVLQRVMVGIALCVILPWAVVTWIIHNLEITWFHIFMVSGLESGWVYLCWDISKWIRQAWDERNN